MELQDRFLTKKSEFIVSVSDSYNNYTPKRGYETSTYLKSTKETIVNEASSLPSPQNSNSINSYLIIFTMISTINFIQL